MRIRGVHRFWTGLWGVFLSHLEGFLLKKTAFSCSRLREQVEELSFPNRLGFIMSSFFFVHNRLSMEIPFYQNECRNWCHLWSIIESQPPLEVGFKVFEIWFPLYMKGKRALMVVIYDHFVSNKNLDQSTYELNQSTRDKALQDFYFEGRRRWICLNTKCKI